MMITNTLIVNFAMFLYLTVIVSVHIVVKETNVNVHSLMLRREAKNGTKDF